MLIKVFSPYISEYSFEIIEYKVLKISKQLGRPAILVESKDGFKFSFVNLELLGWRVSYWEEDDSVTYGPIGEKSLEIIQALYEKGPKRIK
ncbi:MAG: hypothetical protein CME63_01625 [Halobacteriovoraceae bacterium]|nr:hypothetical protein [Halobacteriovoraceae bacterium]|tara:strand:+ start:45939 stop:46211 length:273 start_codon:yes stop_codon:yes gene_type:complete